MQELRAGVAGDAPFFQPWIGGDAAKHLADNQVFPGEMRGVPFHVMGESHYSDRSPESYPYDCNFTQNVVRDWALEKSSGSAFFTRVASIIVDQEPDSFDREAAWQTFAFSNFVQDLLPGPRIPPTPAMLEKATAAFFGQLALTRPEVLVMLGNAVWEAAPADAGCRIPTELFFTEPGDPPMDDTWFYPYRVDGHLVGTVAVKVVHPSAGFGRWDRALAARRVQRARLSHSNILEWAAANFTVSPVR